MNENEALVTEEIVTENTENTAEETPVQKTFTQDEVNEIVGKRIARREAKIRKEYDRKYGDLETILKAGMGNDDLGAITDELRDFYVNKKNISIPDRATEYAARDEEILARADAEEIIKYGDEEAAEEFDRLEKLGAKMTKREQATFKVLAEHLQSLETGRELSKIGVTEDVFNSKEFKDFASKFNPNTPITDVYNIYRQTQPKKEIKTMGSMKNSNSTDALVMDFYTPEEARKFSNEDYNKIPGLFEAVKKSMTKWK